MTEIIDALRWKIADANPWARAKCRKVHTQSEYSGITTRMRSASCTEANCPGYAPLPTAKMVLGIEQQIGRMDMVRDEAAFTSESLPEAILVAYCRVVGIEVDITTPDNHGMPSDLRTYRVSFHKRLTI